MAKKGRESTKGATKHKWSKIPHGELICMICIVKGQKGRMTVKVPVSTETAKVYKNAQKCVNCSKLCETLKKHAESREVENLGMLVELNHFKPN